MSLLVLRRKIPADAAKSGDPRRTAKGASNLLLHFRPAKVPLGLVVRKRNVQVVEQDDKRSVEQERIGELERLIGRLTMELEIAKKASGVLSSPLSRNGW